jgi:hypothetical protein
LGVVHLVQAGEAMTDAHRKWMEKALALAGLFEVTRDLSGRNDDELIATYRHTAYRLTQLVNEMRLPDGPGMQTLRAWLQREAPDMADEAWSAIRRAESLK